MVRCGLAAASVSSKVSSVENGASGPKFTASSVLSATKQRGAHEALFADTLRDSAEPIEASRFRKTVGAIPSNADWLMSAYGMVLA